MTIIGLLMLAMLGVSYYSARWVIWEDAGLHRERTVQFYERNLAKQQLDLAQYARTIRDDLRMQEYIFTVVRIGASGDPLQQLYDEQFRGLPVDYTIILGDDGNVLLGKEHTGLIKPILAESKKDERPRTFYITDHETTLLVAMLPVKYQGDRVGSVAVARRLDEHWLQNLPRDPNNHLILLHNGKVIASTLSGLTGKLELDNNKLHYNGATYQTARVSFPRQTNEQLTLWLAESEQTLVESLSRYNRIMILLLVIGLTLVLVAALIVVNSFSRPVNRLIKITREVAGGNLPALQRSKGHTELDQLLNNFADLTEALRQKNREVEEAHQQLRRSAITDELTSLYNRRYLNEIYPKLLAQAEREDLCLVAILCDLDFFKNINDTYGHAAGDQCLVEFSEILKRNCRTNDFLFRMGGEEFLILSLNHNPNEGIQLAEKIGAATRAQPIQYKNQSIKLTVSSGVSCVEQNAHYQPTHSRLISLADHALYRAKKAGRDRTQFYGDDQTFPDSGFMESSS